MDSNDTIRDGAVAQKGALTENSARLHYLDWLQVLAILGVFLFHATHPFDELSDWIIKNTETTWVLNFFGGFFYPWGMPFFFLMAGAASWFSLRRRTAGRYARERITRLLIPFIVGSIVLAPIQAYYEMTHRGLWEGGSIVEFILSTEARTVYYSVVRPIIFGPEIFNRLGVHLWFVGFLFVFSLIAWPVFTWLKKDPGRRAVGSLARLAQWRGSLLVFVVPLVLVRFALQQGVPSDDYGWPDFCLLLALFHLWAHPHRRRAFHPSHPPRLVAVPDPGHPLHAVHLFGGAWRAGIRLDGVTRHASVLSRLGRVGPQ